MAQSYASLNGILGIDPEKTYVGGGYRDSKVLIKDISIGDRTISAYMDVKNPHVTDDQFTLQKQDAESGILQLMISYRCHREGKTYDRLGEARMGRFHVIFHSKVSSPNRIPISLSEIRYGLDDRNIAHVIYEFVIGDGAFTGRIFETEKVSRSMIQK
jgi:hypothetical protein